MMKKLFISLLVLAAALPAFSKVKEYRAVAVKTYHHDTKAYTQGLFFWNGGFYETTGQWGESSLRQVELSSGKVLRRVDFNKKYFGEGSCVAGGKLYVLTWTNKVAFVYDPQTFKYEKTLSYPREGWGLTAVPAGVKGLPEGTLMVSSDGSSNLYFLDSALRTLRTVRVSCDGRYLRLLNELEWIDGKIWANVYTTDMIVVIDPLTGAVEARIDCSGLFPQPKRTPDMDVLNGIAQAPSGEIFLTGKLWPSVFQITLK